MAVAPGSDETVCKSVKKPGMQRQCMLCSKSQSYPTNNRKCTKDEGECVEWGYEGSDCRACKGDGTYKYIKNEGYIAAPYKMPSNKCNSDPSPPSSECDPGVCGKWADPSPNGLSCDKLSCDKNPEDKDCLCNNVYQPDGTICQDNWPDKKCSIKPGAKACAWCNAK